LAQSTCSAAKYQLRDSLVEIQAANATARLLDRTNSAAS